MSKLALVTVSIIQILYLHVLEFRSKARNFRMQVFFQTVCGKSNLLLKRYVGKFFQFMATYILLVYNPLFSF